MWVVKTPKNWELPLNNMTHIIEDSEQKGGLIIGYLWQKGTDSIHDMCVVNNDTISYLEISPDKCFYIAHKEKIKYLKSFLQQQFHFSPFVTSVYILLDAEAKAALKRIASSLVAEWWQPYSRTCGNFNSRVNITMVRKMHHCIRGSRVPVIWISVQRPEWEDTSGINLYL